MLYFPSCFISKSVKREESEWKPSSSIQCMILSLRKMRVPTSESWWTVRGVKISNVVPNITYLYSLWWHCVCKMDHHIDPSLHSIVSSFPDKYEMMVGIADYFIAHIFSLHKDLYYLVVMCIVESSCPYLHKSEVGD